MNDTNSVESEPRVRFFPGLSEQRQLFLLNTLRSTKGTSETCILDIGCGEGSMLYILCRPALALPIPRLSEFNVRYGIDNNPEIKCPLDKYEHWNVNRVAGLDIHQSTLEKAADLLRPVEDDDNDCPKWSKPRPRWSPMNVKLWKGGLQIYNPEFQDYDVIFSSEVIEHLPEDVLNCFCPIILGRYAPDVLAITTPNYEFNKLFTAPATSTCSSTLPSSSSSSSSRVPSTPSTPLLNPVPIREGGYLDPTGRTNRVFRHSDHKFEWTRKEFQDWCVTQAETWGYTIEIGGVGQSVEKDPWGRDERDEQDSRTSTNSGHHRIGLYASQTAVFRRVEEDKEKHRQIYKAAAEDHLRKYLATSAIPSSNEKSQHEHFAAYTHLVHPSLAGCPSQSQSISKSEESSHSIDSILQQVKRIMTEDLASAEASMFDLWNHDEVAIACRGSLEKLYEALDHAGAYNDDDADGETKCEREWEWVEPKRYARWARRILWRGYQPRPHSSWPDPAENQDTDIWKEHREGDAPVQSLDGAGQHRHLGHEYGQADREDFNTSTGWDAWNHSTLATTGGWGTTSKTADSQKGDGEEGWSGWGPPSSVKEDIASSHGWGCSWGWGSGETQPSATKDNGSSDQGGWTPSQSSEDRD